ncbi:hypothetical protein D9758_000894 [Tetrapyrgos nigripes]|uniref:Zn(2)-C6 fungal-type domain-containing protein n=1 Tax=Tetrapyrgos nigripes TaxID=182062 RepID=A0A8H5LY99_9AGAR|nr:hypothetical protein D9758_000894 [Tetrapyrgos nigripes]
MSSGSSLPEHVPEPMKMIPYVAAPARSRTALACEKCRERKTKCSGEHPACKRCKTRGLVCVYGPRDSKGRYQSAFVVPQSQSSSPLQSSTPMPETCRPYALHSDISERSSRSSEQAISSGPYSSRDGMDFWSSSQPSQNQAMDRNFQNPPAQYQYERQWPRPPFGPPMSSTPFQTDFTSSHPSMDFSNVGETTPLSHSNYPVTLNHPDIRGHRRGHQQQLSASSMSSMSSGGSMPSTPTVMGYPIPQPLLKSDRGFGSDGAFVGTYTSVPTDSDLVSPASYQIDGYQFSGEYPGHQDSVGVTSHRSSDTSMVGQPHRSYMSHPGIAQNRSHTSTSSLDGALDPSYRSSSRTLF